MQIEVAMPLGNITYAGLSIDPSADESTVLGIQAVALTSTLFQYLSPYPVVFRIYKYGTTWEYSHMPYLITFFYAWAQSYYGLLVRNAFMLFINSFGVVVSGTFMIIFVRYCPKGRKAYLRSLVVVGSFFMSLACYGAAYHMEEDDGVYFIGHVNNVVSVLCYLAPLATLQVVLDTKNAESIPFMVAVMNLFSSLSWFLYGVLLDDNFLQVPNFLGFLLSALQLALYVAFPPPRLIII
mmetsp:Transcript_46032/g.107979  ORF Transcript_46032/g.107979 Transcript_46032/m.107979 type:complete len:238 (-) Transcript_46032:289-1002(-)